MSTTPSHQPSVIHPLLRRVYGLRWRAHTLILIRGFAIATAAALLLAILLGTIDWSFRMRSGAWRWFSSGLLLAAIVGLLFRWLVPTLRLRLRSTDVARQVEVIFPSLGDRLSSSIDFLESSRHRKSDGSDLKASVIDQTLQDVRGLSFAAVINPWPTLAAVLAATAICGLLSGLWFRDSATVSHAAARIGQPWRALDWPRRNHLQIDPLPQAVYAGTSLEVIVRDPQADLPSDAAVHVRTSAGDQTYPLRQAGHSGIAQIDDLQTNIQIRATGGDDDTLPWQVVEVVQPPEIERYQWELTPPAYTGQPTQRIEALRIEVAGGTHAALNVTLSKPIADATLVPLGDSGSDVSAITKGKVSDDGREIVFDSLVLTEDRRLQIHWTEVAGANGRAPVSGRSPISWMIQVRGDSPPQVAWSAATRVSIVTPAGSVRLNWTADDDYGLTQTGCHWQQRGGSESTTDGQASDFAERKLATRQRSASGETLFKPADWKLQSGDTITLTAWAMDQQDQRGVSQELSLAIVSEAVIRQQVAENENAIVEKIRDATAQQRSARDQVLSAAAELKSAQSETDAAQKVRFAETAQQQSLRSLKDPAAAIDLAAEAIDLLNSNQINDADTRRLSELLTALNKITEKDADGILDSIAGVDDALSHSPLDASTRSALQDQLNGIAQQQQQVVEQLESLAGDLVKRDAVRDLSRQVNELVDDQQRLQDETEQIDLAGDPDSRARAAALGDAQQELARRATRLAGEVADAATDLPTDQRLLAARLQRASDGLNDAAVVPQMRTAAEDLKAGRLGQAMQKQTQIRQALQSTQEALDGRDRSREESLVDAIDDAAKELKEAADQQQQISLQLQDTSGQQPDLAEEWKQVAQQTERLKSQLAQLGADRAANRLDQAQQQQMKGQQQLQAGDAALAQQSSQRAEQRLEYAQQELADLQRQLDSDQQRKKMWSFIEQMETILADQQTLNAQIPGAPAGRLHELATTQKQLAQRVTDASPLVAEIAGFEFALQNAVKNMNFVAASLARDDRSQAVIDAAEAALARLEHVLAAIAQQMRQSSGKEAADPQQADREALRDGEDENQNDPPAIASIRLLMGLQQWLLDRTEAVEAIEPSDENQRLYKKQAIRQLADQQQSLRQQFHALMNQNSVAEPPQ